MSILGEITDADRRRWQREKANRLIELLAAGANAELPPVTWSVPATGALYGQAMDPEPAARRVAFEAWATWLEGRYGHEDRLTVERWPEREHNGYVHLHVVVAKDIGTGRPLVEIVVTADVATDDEDA
ncbi:hypothetical protein [Streptomyces sp. URMC 129]|uniref:hypothetical protein n=1 Tax=Streptomyces sp. URMC 129 TaxID=3423407 RepID=UPI003F192C53